MKLLVGTPTFDGSVRHADALVHLQLQAPSLRADISFVRTQTSLLTLARNSILAAALNSGATHLLFLDADVEPLGEDWFNVLLRAMEFAGADILGTDVPIKDSSGETGLALETDDPFNPERLTSSRLHEEFPSTFRDDRLLVTTGCMLIKMRPELGAMRPPSPLFNIIDRMTKNEHGVYEASAIPEDYDFCRQCRRAGMVIAATTHAPIIHWDGRTPYYSKIDNQNQMEER